MSPSNGRCLLVIWGSPGDSAVKNLLASAEMHVGSLGWEDSRKKEMEAYSSILAWEIPRTEDSGGLQSMGSEKGRMQYSDNKLSIYSHVFAFKEKYSVKEAVSGTVNPISDSLVFPMPSVMSL